MNAGAVVWVTHIPNRRDAATGMLVPTVNISPAAEHGEIRVLLPPDTSFFATADLIAQMRVALRDYDFKRGDALVALGDPAIILVVGAVLAERYPAFALLRWDRHILRYVRVVVNLREEKGND